MKTPSLKEWREGHAQVGVFIRTLTGETAEFRSRLIEAHNRDGIAEKVAMLVECCGNDFALAVWNALSKRVRP